jgi:hypothetical protein
VELPLPSNAVIAWRCLGAFANVEDGMTFLDWPESLSHIRALLRH